MSLLRVKGLCYIDDTFWALGKKVKGEAAVVILLLQLSLGIEFGLKS
jgi:hypothetical protein